MRATLVVDREQSKVERYEALIRISNSIRARKEPHDLFEVLVVELAKVIPFDAIAQFDESANKVNWHLGPFCRPHEHSPVDDDVETPPRVEHAHQRGVIHRDLRPATSCG